LSLTAKPRVQASSGDKAVGVVADG